MDTKESEPTTKSKTSHQDLLLQGYKHVVKCDPKSLLSVQSLEDTWIQTPHVRQQCYPLCPHGAEY